MSGYVYTYVNFDIWACGLILTTVIQLHPPPVGFIRVDLQGTILSHATNLRQAYNMTYNCRSVLKHGLVSEET